MKNWKLFLKLYSQRLLRDMVIVFISDFIIFLYGLSGTIIKDITLIILIPFALGELFGTIHDLKAIISLETLKFGRSDSILPVSHNLLVTAYRHLLQRTIRQNQQKIISQQQKQNAMNDRFTLWGHNIKTPLTALHLLIDDLPISNQNEAQKQVLLIQHNVDEILNFVSLTQGNNDLIFAQVSIDTCVQQVLQKYTWFFLQKQQSLKINGVPQTLVTDRKWLQVIIEQILINAQKYTPVKGTITINYQQSPQLLQIIDTGPGIPPEDLPRIFENGFTGSMGRKNMNATGIGLYIAAQAANLLNLEIKVYSKVGQGTEFNIQKVISSNN